MSDHDRDDPGKKDAILIATWAGGAIGMAAGKTVGASVAVPATSALVAAGLGPAVLAFGGAAAGAIGAYKLTKYLLKD